MANKDEIELFGQCLFGVLEAMAFIMPDLIGADERNEGEQGGLEARMRFTGYRRGEVCLVAEPGLCEELATNILGVEPDELDEQRTADALREVLNMACGQYLTARFGDRPVFDLTVPEVRAVSPEQWAQGALVPGRLLADAEGSQLQAGIVLEGD